MDNRSSVYFTGMSPDENGLLVNLFHDANKRLGQRWTLAEDADSAQLVIIDLDTMYGHMSWLRAQSRGQSVAALTASDEADADYLLRRPVSLEAMLSVLSGVALSAPATKAEPAAEAAPAPSAPAAQAAAPAPVAKPEPVAAAAAPAPVEAPVAATQARKLIGFLAPNDAPHAITAVSAPGVPALIIHFAKREYLGGSAIKPLLPHAQRLIEAGEFKPLDETRYDGLKAQLGVQPLSRLIWLAALGASEGKLPEGLGSARFKLSKWPQIEREFPKHFRIATTMMKGHASVEDIAAQSGASAAEVNDFIAASLASGHAEIEGASAEASQKRFLDHWKR